MSKIDDNQPNMNPDPFAATSRNRRGGLGRGLDALIPAGDSEVLGTGQRTAPADSIHSNPYQPRSHLDVEALEALVDSIRTHGLLQPVVVMQAEAPGQFVLIAGERRLRAARLAGLREVPVVIKDVSPQEMLELALVENVVRADLSPIEEANAYRQLIEEFGLTQAEIALRVSRSRVTVTNTLRLLAAPVAVQDAVQTREISEGHARALLGLPSGADQLAMLELVTSRGLSVRQTEDEVRRFLRRGHDKRKVQPANTSTVPAAAIDRLERALGAPVSVRLKRGSEAGLVEIAFHSQEELGRIVELLSGDEALF